jgi:hypothetical protein
MQRVKLSLACLLCLTWVYSAPAQTSLQYDTGTAVLQDISGSATFSGTYFNIRTMTGDGVGYRNGFTQIGATLPIWFSEDAFLAPTARVLITDNSNIGASGGALLRGYSSSWDRIFGTYVFFDYDESINDYNYRQWGFGFETLGTWFDARSNVYLPTASGDNFVQALGLGNSLSFAGNNLVFTGVGLFEEALTGADFEVGVPLSPATPWLRGYAGMYFYDAVQEDPVGFRGRIEAWVSDDLQVAVNVTEDQQFGTNVNAVVDFRFSGWKPTRYFPQWTTRERMLMPVQRNWRIAVGYYTQDVPVLAENCQTGSPYFVVWVDSSNTNPGDGSFENPYNYLPNQVPNADLILVRRGDTSLLNPLTGSIALFDNQRLLGEGCEHLVAVCATFGEFSIQTTAPLPGFTDDGNFPYLSSPGNIITLANGNEVAGFNLVNAGGFAIANNPGLGSFGFDLSCLNVIGNAGGIFLGNAGGNGFVTDVNLLNNSAGGLYLDTGSNTLYLTMNNVSATSLPAGVQSIGISLNADEGDLFASLTDVSSSRNGTGYWLSATNQATLGIVTDNVTANDNVGTGMQVIGQHGSIDLRLAGLNANRNGGHGISIVADNTFLNVDADGITANNNTLDNLTIQLTNSTMQVEIDNATFLGSQTGSGVVITNGAGGGTIDLDNVLATGNAADGLLIGVATFAEVDAAVARSIFANNSRNGMALFGTTGGSLDFVSTAVLANANGQDGLHFDFRSNSTLTADVRATLLSNNGRNAVHGFLDNASGDLTLIASRGSNSGADGFYLEATNQSVAEVTIVGGTFADSGQTVDPAAALRIIADRSVITFQVASTPLNNSAAGGPQDDGVNILAINNSQVLGFLVNSDMSLNADNAMELTSDTDSQIVLNLQNSNGNDSGNDGILFRALNNGLVSVTADQSNFDRSGANGINGYLNNGGVGLFDFLASSVAFSGDNGMVIVADNMSRFFGFFEGGSFSNSGQNLNGFGTQDANRLIAHNSSRIEVDLLNTPSGNTVVPGTQQHSLFGFADNGSALVFNNSGGNMSFNTINAINVTLLSGSYGEVDLLNTPATDSGEDGYRFVVSNSQLFSNVTNGSFDNSGAGLVTGSAINGLLVNTGFAQLIFTNTPGRFAYEHGLFVTALGGSVFQGYFDASPFDFAGSPGGVPATAGNAVYLVANASTMDLTMVNGSTGNLAGGDGLVIDAANGSSVTATITDGSFTDEGQFTGLGVGVNVTADNSLVVVNLINTPTDNSIGNITQGFGLLFNLTNGADFFYGSTNGSLSNNSLDGINGSVDGVGTAATLTLSNTLVDSNTFNGAVFSVTNGGRLTFNYPGGGSISNNGGFGVFGTVNGAGSIARFNFEDVAIDNNGLLFGGDGFNVNPTNGGFVEANFQDGSISGNNNRGVNVLLQNGTAFYRFFNTQVNDNGNEGLLFDVSGPASQFVVTAIDASFSDNGAAGLPPAGFSNVNGQVTGGFVDLLFEDVDADASTRHGFNFDISDATGPTSFMAQMNFGTSASNNVNGSGVRLVATGPNTAAHLLMLGLNNFDDNGTAAGVNASNVNFQATNVLQAAVRFSGTAGDADGDGTGSGNDGVTININTAFNAAVEVNGIGTINNNPGEGVDIDLVNIANIRDLTLFTQTGFETVRALHLSDLLVEGNGSDGVSVTITGPTTFTGELVFDGISSVGNQGDGLLLSLTNVAGTPDLRIINGQYADNTGHGINLDLDNSPLDRVTIANNTVGQSSQVGLLFLISGNTFGQPFSITNTSQPGIQLTSFNLDLSPAGVVWDTVEPGASLPFQPQGGSDLLTGLQTINGNPWPNALPGGGLPDDQGVIDMTYTNFDATETFSWLADVDLAGFGASPVFGNDLIGSTVTVAFSDGSVILGALFAVAGDPTASQFQAISGQVGTAGISGNGLDGLHIEQVNSSINQFVIDGNDFLDNGDDGIDFAVVQNSNLVAPGHVLYITNNTITGNGVTTGLNGHGVVLINPQTIDTNLNLGVLGNSLSSNGGRGIDLQLGLPLNTLNARFEGNTISTNGAQGINLIANNGLDVLLAVVNNPGINGNAAEGINLLLTAGSNLNIPQFYGNTIGTSGSSNGSHGVRLTAPDQTTFNWALGNTSLGANLIGGNTDAGVSISMTGNAVGNLIVENTTFSNTAAGPQFGGSGLAITMTDTSAFPVLFIGDSLQNNTFFQQNALHGISLFATGNATLLNPTVQRVLAQGNVDGLNVLRFGSVTLQNFLITNSTFTLNGDDGIDISARNAQLVDEYTLVNSVFSNNGDTGASFDVQADAQIDAVLTNNQFINNGADGVRITSTLVSPGDAAIVFNTTPWTLNTFSNNGVFAGAAGAGLEISGIHNLVIGTLAAGNTFANNAGDGIEVNTSGILTIVNATITGNNTVGSLNGLAGIDINTTGFNAVSVSNSVISNNRGDGVEIDNISIAGSVYTFFDNLITFNGRDGIEYFNTGVSSLSIGGTNPLTNVIADNGTAGVGGRGVDIINAGGAAAVGTVSINNTTIERNRQEGVYVILSTDAAARNANRDALAGAALTDAGAITNSPLLNFSLTNSLIANNGQALGNIGGAGLVMRVGTTGGGYGFANPGGFAGTVNTGVIATVANNSFFGNFGADTLFESFRSTVDPPATGGAWTDQNENPRNFANDTFTPSGFQGDPLARLDLTFTGNILEEVDGTRPGAFYNNNEVEFKSRGTTGVSSDTAADGPPDDNGPFGSGTRQRNAQRLAARDVNPLAPGTQLPPLLTIGLSDAFLFSGLGTSTFRVNANVNVTNIFGAGSGFVFDDPAFAGNPFLYDSTDEANGVFTGFGGAAPFFIDFMPYGWSFLP